MGKIIAFLVVVPFLIIIFIESITFFQYDMNQRYLKDYLDQVSYKVKITGILDTADYTELTTNLSKICVFADSPLKKSINLQYGQIDNSTGNIQNLQTYVVNTKLNKGDVFLVSAISSDVCTFSRIINWGVSIDDTKNIYYNSKSGCRVEQVY